MSDKTKVICPVHYAGVGCEMEKLGFLSQKHDTLIIEDAAHAVNARFQDRFLGTFGGLAALSFHETKNYISGEGGALIVNDESMIERAEILWEKGTNRSKFFQGQVDKYTWVDIGSSFYPSELVSAFLFGQFEETETIMKKRMDLWDYYRDRLQDFEKRGKVRLPVIPAHCRHNAHMFYLLLNSEKERNDLLARFREKNIHAVFHYIPLHTSPMGRAMGYAEGDLPVSEDVSRRILRLPLFFELDRPGQDRVVEVIEEFFG
jgi:dTDP-4-amino-4,6-dideoxygalactose transaminase